MHFIWTSTEKVAGLLLGTRKSERATMLEGHLFAAKITIRPLHSVPRAARYSPVGAGVHGGV